MKTAKYVTIDDIDIYAFPVNINHKSFANAILSQDTMYTADAAVSGAGFVKNGKCCGKSEFLNIGVGKMDQDLLMFLLQGRLKKRDKFK